MKLCIPTIGARLQLIEDWTFGVYCDYRNRTLETLGSVSVFDNDDKLRWESYGKKVGNFTFPKDTVLSLERIYIRQNKEQYDSVTFKVVSTPLKSKEGVKKKMVRFWVKLEDVNNIAFEFAI